MKQRQQVIHVHQADKLTCAELASAIDEATNNITRYGRLKDTHSNVQDAAIAHWKALLLAQQERAK